MQDFPNAARGVLASAVVEADPDPVETTEWLEAFDAVVREHGQARAQYLFDRLADHAQTRGVRSARARITPYRNTIGLDAQPPYPGDLVLEGKLGAAIRWNALAMVMRANRLAPELGGHLASYASAADLFEVGFQHCFKGPDHPDGADLVYFQPHSAPGVYARAYLEGFLNEAELARYRQEVLLPEVPADASRGLSSYPHPWLMADFWQFPTGSMGLGPISAIYQARFLRYLEHRGLAASAERQVWGFFGDGEMDEPESIGALSLAARERLDNLTFVINCNLQRLDGPVRGNSRIIDELEALFGGAGWNVIKVLWGSDWDVLFARDRDGALLRAFAQTVDGQFQTFSANDGAYNRARFFGQSAELMQLVANLSDADIDRLRRGGHDPRKLYAAYAAAQQHRGQPTVILAKTMKGFGLGSAGQGRMTTHQQKKLELADLRAFRDRFDLPLDDQALERLDFHRPAESSPEMRYLRDRRAALGGEMPRRRGRASATPALPAVGDFGRFALEADGKPMSTTMAAVRMLGQLLKDRELGPRIVPIVADEARTFGMANLFRQVGIYAPLGQMYEPEDMGTMLYYREERSGQILEEGISEAGAISSWIAAATSYSVSDLSMLPFYIYYSMFGWQRVGDLIWAAADQRARGFLLGATAGRTTLSGEGLQHQDGGSHVGLATVPNCRAYDPAFAHEVAVLFEHGITEMIGEQQDVFYYLTVGNESYPQPSVPAGTREGIIRGMYLLGGADGLGEPWSPTETRQRVQSIATAAMPRGKTRKTARAGAELQLLGSGAILIQVLQAAELLACFGVRASVWSVTSWSELQRDGIAAERDARIDPTGARPAYVTAQLADSNGPIIAATDYVRALPELIRAFVPRRYVTLGTDGFGRSATRPALRAFFEVDAVEIMLTALAALVDEGQFDATVLRKLRLGLARAQSTQAPWQR